MTEAEYTKDEKEFFELMHWTYDHMSHFTTVSLEEKKFAEGKLKENLENERIVKKWAEKRTLAKQEYNKELYYEMYYPKDITCTNCRHTAHLLPVTVEPDEFGYNCTVYTCPQCTHAINTATPVLVSDRIKIADLAMQAMIKLKAPAKVINDNRKLLKALTKRQELLDRVLKRNEQTAKDMADIVAQHIVILIAYKHNALTGNKRNDVN